MFSLTFGKRWVSIQPDKEHFRVPTFRYSLASCHVMLCSLDDALGRALLNYGRINKVTDLYWIVRDPLTLGCSAGKEYHTFTESQLPLVSTSPPVHPSLRYFNPVHIPGPLSPVSFPNVILPSITRSHNWFYSMVNN